MNVGWLLDADLFDHYRDQLIAEIKAQGHMVKLIPILNRDTIGTTKAVPIANYFLRALVLLCMVTSNSSRAPRANSDGLQEHSAQLRILHARHTAILVITFSTAIISCCPSVNSSGVKSSCSALSAKMTRSLSGPILR